MDTNCAEMDFSKYQGAGNDFIIIKSSLWSPCSKSMDDSCLTQPAVIQMLCHRRFGIGADGVIIIKPSKEHDFFMAYYNSDGKEGSFCGNGARCAVAFSKRNGLFASDSASFEACDGLHQAQITSPILHDNGDAQKQVDQQLKYNVNLQMKNVAQVYKIDEANFFVDTGSPHHVMYVEDIATVEVKELGSEIRYSEKYREIGGTNVNFVETVGEDRVKVRTYERGVEEETYACGTGAVAVAVAHCFRKQHPETSHSHDKERNPGFLDTKDKIYLTSEDRRSDQFPREKIKLSGEAPQTVSIETVKVDMLGGQLTVSMKTNTSHGFHNIYLCGPATKTFHGKYTLHKMS